MKFEQVLLTQMCEEDAFLLHLLLEYVHRRLMGFEFLVLEQYPPSKLQRRW